MPNYLQYHKSLTDELHALKDRIRNLTEHWPTDGEYKEAALRTVLRRHLPSSLLVGRGFIVTEQSSSSQIDLLIADGSKPTLFRDGDLMFVTPDCVRAVIEVKTSLSTAADVEDCAVKLATIGKLCRENGEAVPWLGIFSYGGTLQQDAPLLDAVEAAYQHTGAVIDCLAYGKDRFVRFWRKGELERGDASEMANVEKWRTYRLEHLASAYFVGNVVDALSTLSRKNNAFAWYPLSDGKRVHMQDERILIGRNANASEAIPPLPKVRYTQSEVRPNLPRPKKTSRQQRAGQNPSIVGSDKSPKDSKQGILEKGDPENNELDLTTEPADNSRPSSNE